VSLEIETLNNQVLFIELSRDTLNMMKLLLQKL